MVAAAHKENTWGGFSRTLWTAGVAGPAHMAHTPHPQYVGEDPATVCEGVAGVGQAYHLPFHSVRGISAARHQPRLWVHSASASEGEECRVQSVPSLRSSSIEDSAPQPPVMIIPAIMSRYVDYVDMVYIIMIYIFSLSMETVNIPFPSEKGEVVLELYVVLVLLLLQASTSSAISSIIVSWQL